MLDFLCMLIDTKQKPERRPVNAKRDLTLDMPEWVKCRPCNYVCSEFTLHSTLIVTLQLGPYDSQRLVP